MSQSSFFKFPLQPILAEKENKSVRFCKQLENIRYFRRDEPSTRISTHRIDPFVRENLRCSSAYSIRSQLCQMKNSNEISMKTLRNNLTMDTVRLKFPFLEGDIIVNNISFDKHVFIRYTLDNWNSFQDLSAQYESSNALGMMDKFQFNLSVSQYFSTEESTTMMFAICFSSQGVEYWDNNEGNNYRVDFIQRNTQKFSKPPQSNQTQSPDTSTSSSSSSSNSTSSFNSTSNTTMDLLTALVDDLNFDSDSQLEFKTSAFSKTSTPQTNLVSSYLPYFIGPQRNENVLPYQPVIYV